jgi:hypothetical protein
MRHSARQRAAKAAAHAGSAGIASLAVNGSSLKLAGTDPSLRSAK